MNLGSALVFLDRDGEAVAALVEALAALERVGDEAGRVGAVELGAALLARRGDGTTAIELAASASAARARLRIEPDENDRRISGALSAALDPGGATDARVALDDPSLGRAIDLLRERLGTGVASPDVPSGR